MAGLNKVQLIGNLGRDPEVRTLNDGKKVVNFSIATSESWRDKATGERKERVEWHRIVVFNEGLATIAEQYLKKGSQVYVEGMLATREWEDQSGTKRYSTEVVLKQFNGQIVLLGKGEGRPPPNEGDYGRETSRSGGDSGRQPAPDMGSYSADLNDDIPF